MKTLYLFAILLASSSFIKCQTTYPLTNYDTNVLHSGNYIKDTTGAMDKFVGIWKYTNGSDEFILKIIKKEKDNFYGTDDYYKDLFYGGYKYIKNGSLIIDRLNFTFDGINDPNCPLILGSGNFSNNYNSTRLFGNDIVVNKPVFIDLKMISSTTMQWIMSPRENINVNGSLNTPGPGFGIPTNLILTKQ